MNKVHAKRLLKLAAHLDTVPRRDFKYDVWVDNRNPNNMSRLQLGACGTVACAAGHAAMMPAFKRLGLEIRVDDDPLSDGTYLADPAIRGTECTGADALEEIFGYGTAHLFSPWSAIENMANATPKQVTRRIRKFVKVSFPELVA